MEVNPNDPGAKGRALGLVRKESRSRALQGAFAKVILVVVDGGKKVTVELDTSKADPYYYDPQWEEQMVKVNVVDNFEELMNEEFELDGIEEMKT